MVVSKKRDQPSSQVRGVYLLHVTEFLDSSPPPKGFLTLTMPTDRFEPSTIKNKIKREEVVRKGKKAKTQAKLQKRLAQAKLEASDPALKKVC